MPFHFLHDKEADRVYLAQSADLDPQQRAALEISEEAKRSAARAINNLFDDWKKLRLLEHITLDMIVIHCMQLVAVQNYIEGDKFLKAIRRKIILNHISMKIKEYIDGKMGS